MDSVVGRSARFLDDTPALLNQRVGKLTPKSGSVLYAYYFLSQTSVIKELAGKAGGSANQANISPKMIKELEVSFPSLGVQEQIAKALSSFDELIDGNRKQICLLEEAARRLYKEWFINYRFPGHEAFSMDQTTNLPAGWRHGKLGEICCFLRGKVISKKTAGEGNIPVVAGGLKPAYYHNVANTLSPVITVSASGNAGFARMYYQEVWASDCSFLDIRNTDYLYFVFTFLKSIQDKLYSLQKGSAQQHVNAGQINDLELILPDSHTLQAFEDCLKPIFEQVATLEKQIICAAEARNRLLPKFMSGEIEVS